MKSQNRLVIVLFVLMGLLLVANIAARGARKDVLNQLDLLVDVRHEIARQYVEEPDDTKMIEQAVRGMVESLSDPYTVYMNAKDLQGFDKMVRGSFSGIGAEIDIHNNYVRIVSPLEESPAWKAGVLAGDTILEIDGASTAGFSVNQAVEKLTGQRGTKVVLKVRHESGDEQSITITRDTINVPTVKGLRRAADHHWDYMLDPTHGIGYIRVTQFTDTTANQIRAALQDLVKRNARGLILDLRFNPGGLLESAVEVSDMFLEPGKKIVSVKGRIVPERASWSTNKPVLDPSVPVVVLANEASASAAEIVTGALADNGRAHFVGTRTFGKGSVQQVFMLENGQGALKITNAYYYLPNGRNIHRREKSEVWGVDPTEGSYVAMSPDLIKSMIEKRRDNDALRDKDGKDSGEITPMWIEENLADMQLAAGMRALLGKLDDGQWPEVGKSGVEELVKLTKRDNLIRQRDLIRDRLSEIDQELAVLDGRAAATQPTTQPVEDVPGVPDPAEAPAEVPASQP